MVFLQRVAPENTNNTYTNNSNNNIVMKFDKSRDLIKEIMKDRDNSGRFSNASTAPMSSSGSIQDRKRTTTTTLTVSDSNNTTLSSSPAVLSFHDVIVLEDEATTKTMTADTIMIPHTIIHPQQYHESHLSLGDCLGESADSPLPTTTDDLRRVNTPPTSLSTTPTFPSNELNQEDKMPASVASSAASPQHPVQLYSAIGSLEDPTSGSYAKRRQTPTEFPSSALLIPPAQLKKKSNLVGQSSSQWERPRTRHVQIKTPNKNNEPKRGMLGSQLEKNDDNNNNKPVTKTKNKKRSNKKTTEMFRPSSDAYTPRIKHTVYKTPELRVPILANNCNMGTLSRPNFSDALRRVAMILHQHVLKIERRFENKHYNGIFKPTMRHVLSEHQYLTSRYKCTMVRVPMARTGMVCCNRKIPDNVSIPTENQIYEFAHRLFQKVMLSSECSIVCLIYVERLMQSSKVPLLSTNWRPILLCGLLLASKVWQDLASWNIEFASVYPQYSLENINKMEVEFLKLIKWDLYISGIDYAKYFFALRSLSGKRDFRQRYNTLVGGVNSAESSQARKIQEGSTRVKQEAIAQLSRSCEY